MAKTKERPLGGTRKPTPQEETELERKILGTANGVPRKPRPEPKVVVTFQLEASLDEALEDRAHALSIKKRDIIVKGIRLALDSAELQK